MTRDPHPPVRTTSRDASASGAAAIRAPRPEDMPKLWALLLELAAYEKLADHVSGSADQLAGHLFGTPPIVHGLVAELDGELVGYALFFATYSSFRTEPTMWLEDLFVRDSQRGRGLGRRLLAAVVREARARGGSKLSWEVLDWNTPSIEFYERMGAVRAGGWFIYQLDQAGLQSLVNET
jgi:GNAT superfamily N-acetyltransferase